MLYVNFLVLDYGWTDALVTEFIVSLKFLKLPFCFENIAETYTHLNFELPKRKNDISSQAVGQNCNFQ